MSGLTTQALIRRMDFFTLKLFLLTIEEGQIGRAAVREHIVPSAATKRIQELEDLTGLRLFERNAKGVVPSHVGLVFAKHFRTVLATLDEMRREIAGHAEGVRGYVGIAAPGSLIMRFVAKEIGEFTRRFPLVDLDLRQQPNSNALRALGGGEVDLAVFCCCCELTGDEQIESYECWTDRLVAVVPVGHPLSKVPSISLETLLDQDLIGLDPSAAVMLSLRHAARQIGREPRVKFTVSSVDAARSLVSAGLGIALQPEGLRFTDERDRVVMVGLEGQWAERSYRIGKVRDKVLTPAAEALFQQIKPVRRAECIPAEVAAEPNVRSIVAGSRVVRLHGR